MKNSKSEILLKIAFISGAIVDAFALLPMLIPSLSELMWGFENTRGDYYYAMCMGASLMMGWTILLVWASIRPMERRIIALFTVSVILGMVAAEVFAVAGGVMSFGRALPSFVMQALLTALFITAFLVSRKEMGTE